MSNRLSIEGSAVLIDTPIDRDTERYYLKVYLRVKSKSQIGRCTSPQTAQVEVPIDKEDYNLLLNQLKSSKRPGAYLEVKGSLEVKAQE